MKMPFLFLMLVFSAQGFAAIPKATKQATKQMPKPTSIIRGIGAVSGGQTGSSMALMDFRRTASKKKSIERLVMDFGGADLKAKPGMAGYYHVELSYKPNRLVIELPQILASQLTEAEIVKRVKGSDFIENGILNFDRTAQTMQVVFQLKKAVNVKVLQVRNPKAVGKLVLDITPYRRQ